MREAINLIILFLTKMRDKHHYDNYNSAIETARELAKLHVVILDQEQEAFYKSLNLPSAYNSTLVAKKNKELLAHIELVSVSTIKTNI